ncbi:hypothetical protein OTK49_21200 [Vibrio coralliirubri]|uniref:hypothetical protein n=1 Tax=Vibrio coralliirubri TaxID=1516159 RepID=UPI002284FD04|nr:hypothetical protein [Vibrio coralliirubri]MCY9865038.1 hypothetical protein [Vibrio coralliirubri]
MTTIALNLQSINTVLAAAATGNKTETVWVAVTDCLSSISMAWYRDPKFAIALFNSDKASMPENMQAVLFAFEIDSNLTTEQITESIDEFYAEHGYGIEFTSNANVMSSPYLPQEWVKKARNYDNQNFLNSVCEPISPSSLCCSDWSQAREETIKLAKRNINPIAKVVESGILLIWAEPQVNTLRLIRFDSISDVGLMLNGQIVSYSDQDNDQINHLTTMLELSLDIKAQGAKFYMPQTDEWQDWNWDQVGEVMNKPDFDGLVALHDRVLL